MFVVGVADGQMPLYLARDEQMLAEERHLLYVAVTRARESVRLYHAPVVHSHSKKTFDKPSCFLLTKRVQRCLVSSGA